MRATLSSRRAGLCAVAALAASSLLGASAVYAGKQQPAVVDGSKTVSGSFTVGTVVTYTVTLTNSGGTLQGDNPGDEFTDVLPPTLALVSASATSGSAVASAGTNTVTWNGSLAASGGTVTITINATVLPAAAGTTVTNQGQISYDGNDDDVNETTELTDDPAVGGETDPTSFAVPGLVITQVPTVSGFGLLVLAAVLAIVAAGRVRRRSAL